MIRLKLAVYNSTPFQKWGSITLFFVWCHVQRSRLQGLGIWNVILLNLNGGHLARIQREENATWSLEVWRISYIPKVYIEPSKVAVHKIGNRAPCWSNWWMLSLQLQLLLPWPPAAANENMGLNPSSKKMTGDFHWILCCKIVSKQIQKGKAFVFIVNMIPITQWKNNRGAWICNSSSLSSCSNWDASVEIWATPSCRVRQLHTREEVAATDMCKSALGALFFVVPI